MSQLAWPQKAKPRKFPLSGTNFPDLAPQIHWCCKRLQRQWDKRNSARLTDQRGSNTFSCSLFSLLSTSVIWETDKMPLDKMPPYWDKMPPTWFYNKFVCTVFSVKIRFFFVGINKNTTLTPRLFVVLFINLKLGLFVYVMLMFSC